MSPRVTTDQIIARVYGAHCLDAHAVRALGLHGFGANSSAADTKAVTDLLVKADQDQLLAPDGKKVRLTKGAQSAASIAYTDDVSRPHNLAGAEGSGQKFDKS